MTAAFQLPGQNNTYIPNMEASGHLIISYSRNVKDFNINKYCQIVPVKTPSGQFMRMKYDECARVLNSDLREYRWADGTERPKSHNGTEYFRYEIFNTDRYCYNFQIGDLASKNAEWQLIQQTANIQAMKAMTARTRSAIATLTTTNNYETDHVVDVTSGSTNFGCWDTSLTSTLAIKEAITYVQNKISLDTIGAVKPKDLILVMNPALAREIALSQEIVDYMKHGEYSYPMIKGDLPGTSNTAFGIPDTLYGIKVVIEDSIYVSTPKGATTTRQYVLPNDKAVILARPGGIEGGAPKSPNFSSCVFFMYEEMTTEIKHDPDNRRTEGSIVDHWDCQLVAPASCCLLTDLLST